VSKQTIYQHPRGSISLVVVTSFAMCHATQWSPNRSNYKCRVIWCLKLEWNSIQKA